MGKFTTWRPGGCPGGGGMLKLQFQWYNIFKVGNSDETVGNTNCCKLFQKTLRPLATCLIRMFRAGNRWKTPYRPDPRFKLTHRVSDEALVSVTGTTWGPSRESTQLSRTNGRSSGKCWRMKDVLQTKHKHSVCLQCICHWHRRPPWCATNLNLGPGR